MRRRIFGFLMVVMFCSWVTEQNSKVPLIDFENVSYYQDLYQIEKHLSADSSTYHFSKLLSKFDISPDSLSNGEAVALLFGALNHAGYQTIKLDSLERVCDTLIKQKNWGEAIETASKCENIFPLSIQANFTKWFAYSRLNDSINESTYHLRLNKIFKGMEKSGKNGKLKISHSKFAIKKYLSLVGAGANFKLESKKLDDFENQIFRYSFAGFPENFIIPKKK